MRLTERAARRLHVAAIGLDRRSRGRARKADVLEAVRSMGVLQIDTISVVARSPYLVLFSRLGHYDPEWLDELLADGALFEYWAHEASLLPIEDYALMRPRMLEPDALGWKYRGEWVRDNRAVLRRVLDRLREDGAVRSADFERDGDRAGWWDWKPEKRALEALFTAGDVMVARRQSFQRVYDLRERVHPTWSDDQLPSHDDVEAGLILRAVHALGITTARWVADYYRMDRRGTPDRVRELAAAGELVEARVDGWSDVAYLHPANLDLAGRAADDALPATLTTVLSPFDPLVWDRARARTMFGFDYTIECYTPAAKRRWGYFVLPLLRRGELVGRVDAKAHRRERRFEVKALYLEPGVRVSGALVRDIARALREAADWHATPEVVITRTEPPALRTPLLRAVAAMLMLIVGLAGCRAETDHRPTTSEVSDTMPQSGPLLGLRSGIYHVADIDAARAWYTELLGYGPYFDEPFYVGFDVGGFELGLNPDTSKVQPGAGGTMAYWGVADADGAFERVIDLGAIVVEPVTDVGGGIRHAIVRDPFGNLLGLMENPHFSLPRP